MLVDLASANVADVPEGKADLAEKLGQWLGVTDAITLLSAHPASLSLRPDSGQAPEADSLLRAMQADFDTVRTNLENAIREHGAAGSGRTRIKFPVPQPDMPSEFAADYTSYQRFYNAHQRAMELQIGALRDRLRSIILSWSPSLKQLADLDAALDKILAGRERKLLASVPLMLKNRFEQACIAYRQLQSAHQLPDSPAQWLEAGNWLAKFRQEMQTVLLAELELRLQPVMGLIEAFGNEVAREA
jgi:hypothetical protein